MKSYSIRRDSRAALLASKRAIDSQSKSQRDELLASSTTTEKRGANEKATYVIGLHHLRIVLMLYRDDILMKTNEDVTEALRRTIGLMQGELERSVLSSQMLGKCISSGYDKSMIIITRF